MTSEFSLTPEESACACASSLPPLVVHGLELFNAGEYFEAHEVLETAWRAQREPVRELYRGILQIAVAYYHLLHGNSRGAEKMIVRSRVWLGPFPDHCCGLDLAGFRRDTTRVEQVIQRLGPEQIQRFDRSLLRPIARVAGQ